MSADFTRECPHCRRGVYWLDFKHCDRCRGYVCLDCHTTYAKCLRCRDLPHANGALVELRREVIQLRDAHRPDDGRNWPHLGRTR